MKRMSRTGPAAAMVTTLVIVAGCGRTPPSGGTSSNPPATATAVGPIPGPLTGELRTSDGNPTGVVPQPSSLTRSNTGIGAATNPYAGDRTAAADGRQLFVRFNCSGCHGGRGGGGMGPSLRDVDWIYGRAEAQLYSSIAEGRAHGMPSWQPRLTPDQIWKLVTYINALRTSNEPAAPSTD